MAVRVKWPGTARLSKRAPAIADAEQAQALDQTACGRVVAAGEDEGEEAGRAPEVADEIFVARAGGQRGVEDAGDLRLPVQPARDLQAALLMAGEADGEGAQAAQGEPGLVGAGALAEDAAGALEALGEGLGGGDRAEHQVRMAADIFGAGEDGEIDAERDRGEVERGRPGVVDQGGDTARFGGGADGGDVLHLERMGAGAFEEDGAGPVGDQGGDAGADQRDRNNAW